MKQERTFLINSDINKADISNLLKNEKSCWRKRSREGNLQVYDYLITYNNPGTKDEWVKPLTHPWRASSEYWFR